jgi:hypothetical protein
MDILHQKLSQATAALKWVSHSDYRLKSLVQSLLFEIGTLSHLLPLVTNSQRLLTFGPYSL